ncbi:hypothetical protein [Nocardioides convexus]|uniref:hypothetical protein n=1 Tax=Nocardioides convexus TaxID=2712224 RepID=UPI00241881B1|nr:hypothetical protein [Nocardioides convexus]
MYPVTVDPQFTLYSNADTWVMNTGITSGMGASTQLRAGTYDGGTHLARSFLKFPGDATWNGTQIRGAVLKPVELRVGLVQRRCDPCFADHRGVELHECHVVEPARRDRDRPGPVLACPWCERVCRCGGAVERDQHRAVVGQRDAELRPADGGLHRDQLQHLAAVLLGRLQWRDRPPEARRDLQPLPDHEPPRRPRR